MSSLYDLFGLEPTASADQIRAAWRTTISELDPTDRRFGLLNDAAGVLLDPDKRAAYDDSLEPVATTEPAAPPVQAAVPDSAVPDAAEPPPGVVTTGARQVSGLLLAALAVLVAIVGAGALALALLVPSSGTISEATSEAEQAARRATTTLFSYDYTRLDADQAAADAYLTADYRKKYDELFALVKQSAPGIKLRVESQFIASGLVRTGGGDTGGWFSGLTEAKADRVQVLVFFDQVKTSAGSTTPITFRNFATLEMQRVGDSWLVDGITGPPIQE